MSQNPMISVIMPVYNQQELVGTAIESILSQTYEDFEFIIIDDGSTDNSLKVIQSYQDARIRVIWGKGNRKLVPALNDGIQSARGKYLARMDSDDISLPMRFEEQIKYMEEHPSVDVCGTYFRTIGLAVDYVQRYPFDNEDIKMAMIFFCPLAHPTVMIRRSTMFEKGLSYDKEFSYAEDYELWSRMSAVGCNFHNIPRVLLRYRMSESHISSVHGERQRQLTHRIVARNFVEFGVKEQDVQPLLNESHTRSTIKEAARVFDLLFGINQTRRAYNKSKFDKSVSSAKFRFLSEYLDLGGDLLSCVGRKDVFSQPISFLRLLLKIFLFHAR